MSPEPAGTRELRLVPAGVAVWAAAALVLTTGPAPAALCVGTIAVGHLIARHVGQAVLSACLGTASLLIAWFRLATTRAWQFAGSIRGTVSGAPVELDNGSVLVRVRLEGYPGPITVVTRSEVNGLVSGARVSATGSFSATDQPGTAQVVMNGAVTVEAGPTGMARVAQYVRDTFADAVSLHVDGAARGLIPGMTLGDTSLQTVADRQTYIASGLSHLSAVSGSNVAVVTAAAVSCAAFARLGLRAQTGVAGVSLMVYAVLVGPEPSVLRASVMGLVALVAVLSSSISQPIHALSLAVVGLVLVDSNVAVSYGFALSVAATAGIVLVSPIIRAAIRRHLGEETRCPDALIGALSVAIAADAVTAPVVACMTGRVSLVAVAANLLVTPVVAPVTVLGLLAALLALVPGGAETLVLWVTEPLAAWIAGVAHVLSASPSATVSTGPVTAAVIYGWILTGVVGGRPRLTLAAITTAAVIAFAPAGQRGVDLDTLTAHVVATEEEIDPVPTSAQLVVVLERGPPHARPVRTAGGVPVLYPNRDGRVRVLPDGTQRSVTAGF
ncbi:ComEC/Rec2 family competence protein [Corynebacterium capitovis]|uniref:ComEC/Rec2 family competence protein n=1 Tax=Corynebacterium capitovis TaxID=131081 RepID=UPI00036895BE|nr:ComEC/Rec2 family competence protein [Corynebacterium capitovis]